MLGTSSPEYQQLQRIDKLTEAVHVLTGHVAALTAVVAKMIPIPGSTHVLELQGLAQRLAPDPGQSCARTQNWPLRKPLSG